MKYLELQIATKYFFTICDRLLLQSASCIIMGLIRTSAVQIFSKNVFWLRLPWMFSLLDVVYETSTFFQITVSDDVIFKNN